MEAALNIDLSAAVAVTAALIAAFSALYARRSAKEARRANDIGRLNALLSLRQHYLERMRYLEVMVKQLEHSQSGKQSVEDTYADLDSKLRQVAAEIDLYHSKVVKNKM
ncbi:hypothetical protein [Aeromonas rivipollensis]|uniref:hypothetical protein n=1 Tax=Aeromonas rivipollensis TaxID=948519 RepID=UPI0038D706D2